MQELYRKINSQLNKIERKLLVALKRFYNKYIRGKIDPVEIIRQQRGGYVYNLISEAIRSSVFINPAISNVIILKDSTGDIRKLIISQYEQFWKTVSKLRMREDELKTVAESQIVPPAVIPKAEKKQEFNVEASLIGLSGWVVFNAFNTSMVFFALGEEVVFMTVGDKKVDKKICRPLHGRTFNINDPLIPKPPLHVHCRCMLLPSIS